MQTVRFGDCDPAGIVYFPTIYHYCHIAFEEAWSAVLGTRYDQLVGRRRLGFPTVRVETDFVSPVRYGDSIDIIVTIPHVGRSSVVFEFNGRVGSREAFHSSHTKVCTDLDTLSKQPVPADIREAMSALMGPD